MFCEHCGQKIKGRYCEGCGYDNDPQDIYNYETGNLKYKPKTTSPMPTWVKVLLVIFVLGTVGKLGSYVVNNEIRPTDLDNPDVPVAVFTAEEAENSTSSTTDFSFRNTYWGMSMDELISVEDGEADKKSDDYCVYNNFKYDEDFTANLIYLFDDDELYAISLRKNYTVDKYEECMQQHSNLMQKMILSYGAWNTEESNQVIQNSDDIIRNSTWLVPDTSINLVVREEKDGDEVTLYLMFIDKNTDIAVE